MLEAIAHPGGPLAQRGASDIAVHLGIPVHFLKVHESGIITKAYENDDVNFPTDRLGSIEGQMCCRRWTSRVVFDEDDLFNPYYQYTDTGNGTYWCTARVEQSSEGAHSVSVGVRFDDTRWFRGRDTPNRGISRHAVETCCRRAPADLEAAWRGEAWPNVRTPRTLLATLPTGAFPGVDATEMYAFLQGHAPEEKTRGIDWIFVALLRLPVHHSRRMRRMIIRDPVLASKNVWGEIGRGRRYR